MGAARRRLSAACDEALALTLPATVRDEVLRARRDLDRPLRLAVVGRIKSGKSTLVNALLGQRVARVDASECTRAVTWFSYGHQEKVVVHTRDDRSWTLAFGTDGYVPADLGAAPEEIAGVEVVLCNDALAGTTVIDTPGLDSLTADASRRTDELLGLDGDSRRAPRSCRRRRALPGPPSSPARTNAACRRSPPRSPVRPRRRASRRRRCWPW